MSGSSSHYHRHRPHKSSRAEWDFVYDLSSDTLSSSPSSTSSSDDDDNDDNDEYDEWDGNTVCQSEASRPNKGKSSQNKSKSSGPTPLSGAALNHLIWPRDKRRLKVRFLNGDSKSKRVVKDTVREHYHAVPMGMRFEFLSSEDPGPSDIRISFIDSEVSSCMVGRNAEKNPGKASMWLNLDRGTLGIRNRDDVRWWRQHDILHEFGHALGMEHEHTHPDCNIKFDFNAILSGRYNGDAKKMHTNYDKISSKQVTLSAYDQHSIMHYPVVTQDTTNGAKPVHPNNVLSDGDKKYLMRIYPAEANLEPDSKPAHPQRPRRPTTKPEPMPKPLPPDLPRPSRPHRRAKPTIMPQLMPEPLPPGPPRPSHPQRGERPSKRPEPKVEHKAEQRITGSGYNIIRGGNVVISGSGTTVIRGGGNVTVSGSANVIVHGDSNVQVSGSARVHVIGSGTASVAGSAIVSFTGAATGETFGSGSIRAFVR